MTCFTTSRGPVEIRELSTIDDMVGAEKIQLLVWGAETTPHPKEMLIPVQFEGGLLAGAFLPGGEMIGIIFQFPTRDPALAHSQMLAVIREWRGEGIGRRLKWYQRNWCLEHGITHVRWTVDPLRAANAELNIRRLGATSSIYLPNYYGPMQGIDAGVPTDRLLIEWQLTSLRVNSLAAESSGMSPPPDEGFPHAELALVFNGRKVERLNPELAGLPLLVPIPDDFIHLSKSDPDLALAWRRETRSLFTDAFNAGYMIGGFTRANGPAYLLRKKSYES